MKTLFQISITSGRSAFTKADASLPPILSKWISVQGPHGPVAPISLRNIRVRTDEKSQANGYLNKSLPEVIFAAKR